MERKWLAFFFKFIPAVFGLGVFLPVWGQSSRWEDSIQLYRQKGNYLKALEFAQIWQKDVSPQAHDSLKIDILETIADLQVRLNENQKAIPIIHQWIDLLHAAHADSLDYAAPYNRLGTVYYNLADFPKSILFYEKSKELRIKHYGPDHPEVARSLSNLGNVYLLTGDYRKAEELYVKTHEIRLKHLPANDAALGHSCNGLGLVYRSLGDYIKAESYFIKGLAINQSRLGPDHPNVGAIFNNLGTLAEFIGDYGKAEKYFLEGLRIRKLAHGDSNVLVAQNYFHLARLYEAMQQWEKAETMLERGGAIYLKAYGPDHLFMANCYFLKGQLWTKKKKFDLAEKDLQSAKTIWLGAFGAQSLKVGQANGALARYFNEKGAHNQALALLKSSYALHKKHLGLQHPELGNIQYQMAGTYVKLAMEDSAYKWYKMATKHYQEQISRLFPVLSEREKEKFFHLSSPVFKEFLALALLRQPRHPQVAGEMYDLILNTKALLLHNSSKWKKKISGSGDRKLIQLFTQWESNQNLIAKLITLQDSTISDSLTRLTEKNEKLEKELSSRYKDFNTLTERKSGQWQKVAQSLKPTEAAIEIIKLNPWEQMAAPSWGKHPAKRMNQGKKLQDIGVYVALVVQHKDKFPKLVFLPDGQLLEGRNFNFYQNCIRKKMKDTLSYKVYWETISKAVGKDIKRIYVSPDGVYHFINPATLYNTHTHQYLLEEQDIRLVTVTNDLLDKHLVPSPNRLAYLFGNPVFKTAAKQKDSAVSRGSFSLPLWQKNNLTELPGSNKEVKTIANQLIENGWEVYTYAQEEATEEHVKDIFTPRVLHLATHGYFIHDSTLNPLICSGLFLTHSLKENQHLSSEDGILTAYEAMNLNLDNTDLVVLSACETGLGEIKNGEGVYGLQRAFKVAGAKTIIMSLWKVDDEATQELMVSFYKHWLQLPESSKLSGSSKRQAFLKAQKELKAKYPNPYYWGAFVMVGE